MAAHTKTSEAHRLRDTGLEDNNNHNNVTIIKNSSSLKMYFLRWNEIVKEVM